MTDDRLDVLDDEETSAGHGDRFRAHFALPASEKLQAAYLVISIVFYLFTARYTSVEDISASGASYPAQERR